MAVVCLSNKNGLSYTYTYIYTQVTCVHIYVTTIKEKLEDEFEREQGAHGRVWRKERDINDVITL